MHAARHMWAWATATNASVRVLVLLAGLALVPAQSSAQAPKTYLWAEDDGTVHVSVRLEDVAEPFASIYRAQALVGAQGRASGAAVATGLEADRAKWQQKLARAREALLAATASWANLKSQDDQLQINPLLRLTPQVASEHQEGQEPLQLARQRYLAARKDLLINLPEQARRAQVPMAWIQ